MNGWETAEEYLSGHVQDKLVYAEYYAEKEPDLFSRNVRALEEAPLLHRILTLLSVRLGYRLSIIGSLCMKPLILRPSTVMRVKMTAKKSVLPLTIWNTQRSGEY